MKKRDTKQTILDQALELFSTSGYDGVTVADIAAAVGIKAASLYKHYKSKQDIFDSILAKAAEGYQEQAAQLGLDGQNIESDSPRYADMGLETLIQTGISLFLYFLRDQTARKLRRLLTIEQYKNPAASGLFTDQYINAPLAYQGALFKTFIGQGFFNDLDGDVAAAHFYAPIYLMLCLCDNCPEREPEAVGFIQRHITQFESLYRKGAKE
ncbi:MAG: TetR/AcrR family transcriptional regulator [Oscillospiraceae bacterium]|nr:TetR/AcrR family transcriptional regulator [Oscillospiraceae bacterium]